MFYECGPLRAGRGRTRIPGATAGTWNEKVMNIFRIQPLSTNNNKLTNANIYADMDSLNILHNIICGSWLAVEHKVDCVGKGTKPVRAVAKNFEGHLENVPMHFSSSS